MVLINLFKYPFFEFAYRYTAATGNSLLEGYKKLGNWVLNSFFVLSFLMAVINFVAVTKVTSDIALYLFKLNFDPFLSSISLLSLILFMLFIGRYSLLDKSMKVILLFLTLFTILAFVIAIFKHDTVIQKFTSPPDIWNFAGITFLIAFMGWMPTPIDAAVWPSLWTIEKSKQTQYLPSFSELKFDFHLGYIGSAVIAFFFLGLGALVMFGTGENFSENGIIFSQQLVTLYSSTIGQWSTYVIAIIAFLTMLSTAITVIDGYPRSLSASLTLIYPKTQKHEVRFYHIFIIFLSVSSVIILTFFTKNMRVLLEFATIVSFITAPIFAIFNYKAVTAKFFSKKFQPPRWLNLLSIVGIIFLIGFTIVYLYILITV